MQERVEVVAGADPASVQLLRLTGAFVAMRAGFGYDEAEDMRLAVDELCTTILDVLHGPGCELRMTVLWGEDGVDVRVALSPADGAALAMGADLVEEVRRRRNGADEGEELTPGRISQLILDALVDEHGMEFEGGALVGWFRKQRVVEPT